MLLYITAEDVFGSDRPEHQGPRPLHRIPETVAGLYDLGLRHHIRQAAMSWPADGTFEAVPDWKFDRLAIRLALFGRERGEVEPGDRIAVFGRLGWLWPVVDFGAMGFGVVPVGLEHDLADEELVAAVKEARPKLLVASDPESTERAKGLKEAGRLGETTVVAAGLPEGDGLMPIEKLLELASVLDTAERAQSFRAVSRQVSPDSAAFWHFGSKSTTLLSHREAMSLVEPRLKQRPAFPGDVAYLEGPRATLGVRLALAAFVGDGHTTAALGSGNPDEEVPALRPHKLLATREWIESRCDGQGPRWPAGLDRPWARKRLLERLGGQARWVEVDGDLSAQTRRALDAAGVTTSTGLEEAGLEKDTVH